MSWSLIKPIEGVTVENAAERLANPPLTASEPSPQVLEQVKAAAATAQSLIDSKAVGDEGATFNVTMSGHANPNHKPTPGWANDTVTVSVTQMSYMPLAGEQQAEEPQGVGQQQSGEATHADPGPSGGSAAL